MGAGGCVCACFWWGNAHKLITVHIITRIATHVGDVPLCGVCIVAHRNMDLINAGLSVR